MASPSVGRRWGRHYRGRGSTGRRVVRPGRIAGFYLQRERESTTGRGPGGAEHLTPTRGLTRHTTTVGNGGNRRSHRGTLWAASLPFPLLAARGRAGSSGPARTDAPAQPTPPPQEKCHDRRRHERLGPP